MENATRALLMAAGVLVGMLIISLAVYLYYSLGGYVADRQEVIDANATAKFNEKFLKYDYELSRSYNCNYTRYNNSCKYGL